MKNFSILLAIVLTITACTISVGDQGQDNEPVNVGTTDQQESVLDAARLVVDQFDQGQFDEVWATAGPLIRSKTNQAVFSTSISAMRNTLGPPGHREVKGFNFPKTLDGVEGNFGLIAVQTDFKNAKGVEEKLVFQMIDGKWQLSGYWLSKKTTFGAQ